MRPRHSFPEARFVQPWPMGPEIIGRGAELLASFIWEIIRRALLFRPCPVPRAISSWPMEVFILQRPVPAWAPWLLPALPGPLPRLSWSSTRRAPAPERSARKGLRSIPDRLHTLRTIG